MADLKKSIDEAKRYITDAANFRHEQEAAVEERLEELRIDSLESVAKAGANADYKEQAAVIEREQKLKETANVKYYKKVKKEDEKYQKDLAALKQKYNNKEDDNNYKADLAKLDALHEQKIKNIDEEAKKADEAAEKAAKKEAARDAKNEKLSKYGTLGKAIGTISDLFSTNIVGGLSDLTSAVGDFVDSLKSEINNIAGYKSSIDTRLQGSKSTTSEGSY